MLPTKLTYQMSCQGFEVPQIPWMMGHTSWSRYLLFSNVENLRISPLFSVIPLPFLFSFFFAITPFSNI